MITENLSTLKIHKLTQAQYDRELAAGNIDENALYLTPDEELDLSGYATADQLDSKADIAHTHDDYAPKESPVFTGSISLGRKSNTDIGTGSVAIGCYTTASSKYSHAEGYYTIAKSEYAHAEGQSTTAYGACAHAEGCNTTTSGAYTHAEGQSTTASGLAAHAEGYSATASGRYSHAGGYYTSASKYAQTAIGSYNIEDKYGSENSYSAKADALIIGNGTSSTRSNAFRVVFDGKAYGGTYSSSGADYAEYFEWADGNPDNEDRIGLFVTLTNGGYIKIAQPEDDILGVVSGNGSVIGDSYDDTWHGMWMRDVYGRLLYEDVEVEHEDENGEKYTVVEHRMKLNPDYNPDEEYIPRSERKEWDAIGMFGKLVLNDDGSCVVGGCCSCGENGIATASETGYRVMARLDDSHVRILVK